MLKSFLNSTHSTEFILLIAVIASIFFKFYNTYSENPFKHNSNNQINRLSQEKLRGEIYPPGDYGPANIGFK